jgi:hypothetical protein
MKTVSALLRIISGLALLFAVWSVYSNNSDALAGKSGANLSLFGHATNLSPGQLKVLLLAAALLGLLFTALGVMTFLRREK